MKLEPVKSKKLPAKRRADQYNDPSYNHLRYWESRDYEHAAEEIAIRRLLGSKRFRHAVDVGGGYGRLCLLLEQFADKVTLADPSKQQLDRAKQFLKDHPSIECRLLQADDLKFPTGSIDLLVMVRVLLHLPDPAPEFAEIARVLSSDGYAIIEVANLAHARNRFRSALVGKRLPADPVDIRSEQNRHESQIPFVNHNPDTVIRQLAHAGLKVERSLSVSNLRSPIIKKLLPKGLLLFLERLLQKPLTNSYFGPSMFFLVRKG